MLRFNDLAGKRFGRLLALEPVGRYRSYIVWKCKCDCGKETIVTSGHLKSGHTKSCGCLLTKHKDSNSRLYSLWHSMKRRCDSPKAINYKYYGGRGIKVCEEWEKNYISFKAWAIENGYKDGLSIDRIDVNDGYSPDNCRWVNIKKQGANKRNNNLWTYKGETKHIAEWARIVGISQTGLLLRVTRSGWSIEKALTTKPMNYPRNKGR